MWLILFALLLVGTFFLLKEEQEEGLGREKGGDVATLLVVGEGFPSQKCVDFLSTHSFFSPRLVFFV